MPAVPSGAARRGRAALFPAPPRRAGRPRPSVRGPDSRPSASPGAPRCPGSGPCPAKRSRPGQGGFVERAGIPVEGLRSAWPPNGPWPAAPPEMGRRPGPGRPRPEAAEDEGKSRSPCRKSRQGPAIGGGRPRSARSTCQVGAGAPRCRTPAPSVLVFQGGQRKQAVPPGLAVGICRMLRMPRNTAVPWRPPGPERIRKGPPVRVKA